MSLVRDIIDRVLSPNREMHVIPVLDGAFSRTASIPRVNSATKSSGPTISHWDPTAPLRVERLHSGDARVRTMASAMSSPAFRLWSAALLGRRTAGSRGFGARPLLGVARRRDAGWLEAAAGGPDRSDLGVGRGRRRDYVRGIAREHARSLPPISCKSRSSGRLIALTRNWFRPCMRRSPRVAFGAVVSRRGDQVWVSESSAQSLTAISRENDRRRAIVENYAGYPARMSRGSDGTTGWRFSAFARSSPNSYPRARVLRGDDEDGPARAVDRSDLGRAFQLSWADEIGRIKKLGIQKPWAPARSYGLVARLNAEGEASESLHSRVDGQSTASLRSARSARA